MTDTPILPDWVLIEGAKRCQWDAIYTLGQLQLFYANEMTYRALCDMILKHERPPVDRKRLCAEEAIRLEWERAYDFATVTSKCIRAIELWEEGFGK